MITKFLPQIDVLNAKEIHSSLLLEDNGEEEWILDALPSVNRKDITVVINKKLIT